MYIYSTDRLSRLRLLGELLDLLAPARVQYVDGILRQSLAHRLVGGGWYNI